MVPSYRRFCEELGIPFHFWDQLPESDFDPAVARKEVPLHKEAMDLFNRLKPELVLFKGDVIGFQFTDWGGGFTYTRIPLSDFLETAADDKFFVQKLQRRFDIVTGALVVLTGLGLAFFVASFTPRWLVDSFGFLIFPVVFLTVSIWLEKRIKRLPRHIVDDGRLNKVGEKLVALRTQLEQIRGTGRDPLTIQREVRLGMLVLQELSDVMEPEQIRHLVRRLQSNLRLVQPPENSV